MERYIVLTCQLDEEFSELLQAELLGAGFDSFLDEITGFVGSSALAAVDLKETERILQKYKELCPNLSYTLEEQGKENWNAEWEKGYEPVYLPGICYIKHPTHPKGNDEGLLELIVYPNMSFGTGHHPTTSQVIKSLASIDLTNKSLLDVGSGTGVLAIYAALRGAKPVLACDNDQWCIENTLENASLNQCSLQEVKLASAEDYIGQHFDFVLANIHKMYHLEHFDVYEQLVEKGSHLLISGFLVEDQTDLDALATKHGFALQQSMNDKNWLCLHYIKI